MATHLVECPLSLVQIRKGTNQRTVIDDDIERVQQRINCRPKKCLGFKQPAVIIKEMMTAA